MFFSNALAYTRIAFTFSSFSPFLAYHPTHAIGYLTPIASAPCCLHFSLLTPLSFYHSISLMRPLPPTASLLERLCSLLSCAIPLSHPIALMGVVVRKAQRSRSKTSHKSHCSLTPYSSLKYLVLR